MGFREGTGVDSIAIDGELFEARLERNRNASLERFYRTRREVQGARTLVLDHDNGACLVCGSRLLAVRPIYGDRLPGCCPMCWQEAREAVLAFVSACIEGLKSRVNQVPGGTGVLVQIKE